MNSFKLDLGIGKKSVCSNCGFVGRPIKEVKGNILIEVVLWLFILLPGLIYSLWRRSGRKFVCPQCKQTTMVPLDSPVGQKLAEKYVKN